MRQLTRGTLAALCALMLWAAPVGALGAGDDVAHLTIYDAGVAEFHEERTIELQPGLNQIEWRSLMPKAYLRTLRVTAEGAEVVLVSRADEPLPPTARLFLEELLAAGWRRA